MTVHIKEEITFHLAFFTFPSFLARVFKKLSSHSKGPENVLDNVLEKDQATDFPAPSSLSREAGEEINGNTLLAKPTLSRNPQSPSLLPSAKAVSS